MVEEAPASFEIAITTIAMKPLILTGAFLLAGYAIHEFAARPEPDQLSDTSTQRQLERTQRELDQAANQLVRAQNQLKSMATPAPTGATPSPFPLARASSTPPAWFQQRLNDETASLSGTPSGSDSSHLPSGGGRRH